MSEKRNKPLWILIAIFAICVLADQVTKQWAQRALLIESFHERTEMYPPCGDIDEDRERERFVQGSRLNRLVVDGFFNFKYVENCASAFGLMSRVPESFRFPFFIVVSLMALTFIPYLYFKTPREHIFMLYGLPFILGGAVGNLIDRLVYRYVIDFIDWYVTFGNKSMHWPTFNIADAAIVIGIGLMIVQMFFKSRSDEAIAQVSPAPNGEDSV